MWPSDLADTAKREFIVSLGPQGEAQLEAVENKARADAGNAGDFGKNPIYIGYFLERLNKANGQSPSLDRLCEKILQFFFRIDNSGIAILYQKLYRALLAFAHSSFGTLGTEKRIGRCVDLLMH